MCFSNKYGEDSVLLWVHVFVSKHWELLLDREQTGQQTDGFKQNFGGFQRQTSTRSSKKCATEEIVKTIIPQRNYFQTE